MSIPAYAHLISFFYPIGNTPAVSLTQSLPLGKSADILLLGCGDARNILFTSRLDGTSANLFLLEDRVWASAYSNHRPPVGYHLL